MGNDFGLWLVDLTERLAQVRVALPKSVDILCIDKSRFGSAQTLMKYLAKYPTRKFVFIASDGPIPTAKVLRKHGERFQGEKWAQKLPDSEALVDAALTEMSKTMGSTRIVYSHKFVIGEADYKIGEFYCNWARSPSYTPGLTYLVESCDSDVLLVTLGFHEEHCFFVRDEVCYDLGALRRHICQLMGGGDVRRRVDDFRALATFAACDFRGGCGRAPDELIKAYKAVTQDRQDFLVDGDNWNVDLLREFFNELAETTAAWDFTVDECKNYFQGLKWLLRLYNGFCPAWDFCPHSTTSNFRALADNIDKFDETGDFESDMETLLELPVTVIKLTQEAMPKDAPSWVKESEVFKLFEVKTGKTKKVKTGKPKKVKQVATLSEIVERYKTQLRDQLIRKYPDLEKLSRRIPWVYCRGEHSAVRFSRQRPDFESVFRSAPRLGSIVIYRGRGIGRLMEVNSEKCQVNLYHFNLDQIQEGVVTASKVGSVWCDVQDLTWAGGGAPLQTVEFGDVIDGEPYICLGSEYFGVVGVPVQTDKMKGLLVSANQICDAPKGHKKAVMPFSRLKSVAHFDQCTVDELRDFIK